MVTRNRPGRPRDRRLRGPEALEQRRVLAAVLSMEGPTEPLFEGERAEFTLRLSERSTRAEAVDVTTRQGSATLGVDYAAPQSQRILFAPGETVKRFTINTLVEAVPRTEGAETFLVTATPANPRISGPLSRQVTIVDTVPKPAISIADITVDEGASGNTPATFTLRLSESYPRSVTVTYATRDGSATVAGNDYTAASGQVTFRPGETTQTVTVNVTGDRFLETDETFTLVLSSPTNATFRRGTATCTIRNDEVDAPGFQITLAFTDAGFGEVPAAVQQIAREAAQRWSRIIIGDLPNVTTVTPEGTIFIDDLELTVQMGLLDEPGGSDGPGNGLANASYTELRTTDPRLPYQAITGLDPEDVTGTLTGTLRNYVLDVITHEMGHALGFDPELWLDRGFLQGTLAAPLFVGANALREYRTLFNAPAATGVPVEGAAAGPGTAFSHWRDTVFGTELMTGFVSPVGIRNFISRVTIGSLQDIGYTVNYAAAEPYVRPRLTAGVGAPATTAPVTRPSVAKPVTKVPVVTKAQDAKALAAVATEWQVPAARPGAVAQFARLAGQAAAAATTSGSPWLKLETSLRG